MFFNLNKISQKICVRYSYLNLNVRREMFYSSVPAEAVTIAILKDASFHSWCCLMNRKVKSLKQTVFLWEKCVMSKVTTSVPRAVFQPWHRTTIVFPLVYCPVSIRSQPRNSLLGCVKSLLLLWQPHDWFCAYLKTFLSLPKIIGKRLNVVNCCSYLILFVVVRFFLRHRVCLDWL